MKKSWSLFWILTVMLACAVTGGGIFTAKFSGVLCAVFVPSGAAAWVIFFLHFRSIGYSTENGSIIIRSGFFIKAERRILIGDILWSTTVKIGSTVLFSVIHTAAGRAFLFARADLFTSLPK